MLQIGQDNNDEDDGNCFQFTYFATNLGVGLLIWERGDDYVDFQPILHSCKTAVSRLDKWAGTSR